MAVERAQLGRGVLGLREEFVEALAKATRRPATKEEALILASANPSELPLLLAAALKLKVAYTGNIVTYSRKVFVPLTNLCRNECKYCGFRRSPKAPDARYLSPAEAMNIVKLGERLGAKEVLVSTGERPEDVHEEARSQLRKLGFTSTLEYVIHFEEEVLKETEYMMPHTNVGVLSKGELAELKELNASMGLMLESISERLLERGGPHELSPTKHPSVRLKVLEDAGSLRIPFTTGILVGIGESWEERVESLIAIRDVHARYGHIQEVIVQNFMPEPGTPMEGSPPPALEDVVKTIAVARLIFHGEVSIQAPPNLAPNAYAAHLLSGINDWGGISPLTPDFINASYPWPKVSELKSVTEGLGFTLRERLPIYPKYIKEGWYSRRLRRRIESLVDDLGLVRSELEGLRCAYEWGNGRWRGA